MCPISLSDIYLFDEHGVSVSVADVDNPGGMHTRTSETPPSVIDGDNQTKWIDLNFTYSSVLRLRLSHHVHVAQYELVTAAGSSNAERKRDPTSWYFGIFRNGTDFEQLSEQSNVEPPHSELTSYGRFFATLPPPPPSTPPSWPLDSPVLSPPPPAHSQPRPPSPIAPGGLIQTGGGVLIVDDAYAIVNPGQVFGVHFYAHTGNLNGAHHPMRVDQSTLRCADVDVGDGVSWGAITYPAHCMLISLANRWDWSGVQNTSSAPRGCFTMNDRVYFNTNTKDSSSSFFKRICEPLSPFWELAAWHVELVWNSEVLEWAGDPDSPFGGCLMKPETVSGLEIGTNQSSFVFVFTSLDDVLHGAFELMGTCFLRLREDVPTSTVQESVLHSEAVTFVNQGHFPFVEHERFVVVRADGVVSWALDLSVSQNS